jgi:hypothetical protein
MTEQAHQKDSDCTVDPATNSCSVCNVDHSGLCYECGGRGYHGVGCVYSDATEEAQ